MEHEEPRPVELEMDVLQRALAGEETALAQIYDS